MEVFGNFDFGLTAEEEERAARLHEASVIVDMLFQGPCSHRSFSAEMDAQLREMWDRRRDRLETWMTAFGMPVRMAAQGLCPEFQRCWEQSGVTAGNRQFGFLGGHLLGTLAAHQASFDKLPWLIKALHAADIRRAKGEGKRAGFLSSQNCVNESESGLIDAAYEMGARMIQLTYNSMNSVGAGCTERTDAGVSNFGARVIKHMNQLGIIVDTGHCGRQTTLDACLLSERPVVASHTSAKSVYDSVRAKGDEELRAIAGTDGVVGVYVLPPMLASRDEVTIEDALDHVDYIANLVGWRHVGIGTDWPYQCPEWVFRDVMTPYFIEERGFRTEDLDGPQYVAGFDDYRDFPNLTRGLMKRGYADEQVRGILGENFLRVFEAVCG